MAFPAPRRILMMQASFIVSNFTADPLPGMTHCTAHGIDRRPGNEALEPGDFFAGLFIGETVPDKDKAENTVALDQEFCDPGTLFSEDNSPVGYMGEIPGFGNLGDCFGDGRWIDIEPRRDIVRFDGPSLFEDTFKVFNFSRREFEAVRSLHSTLIAGES